MNAPAPDLPPDTAERVADIMEYTAKTAVSLSAVWAFIALIARPFTEWRRKRLREAIREALKPELAAIADMPARETETNRKLDIALRRQDQVFDEIDLFVLVVADNRERLAEMQDLLDSTAGLTAGDRRRNAPGARRRLADEALQELQGKLRARRRARTELAEHELEVRPE